MGWNCVTRIGSGQVKPTAKDAIDQVTHERVIASCRCYSLCRAQRTIWNGHSDASKTFPAEVTCRADNTATRCHLHKRQNVKYSVESKVGKRVMPSFAYYIMLRITFQDATKSMQLNYKQKRHTSSKNGIYLPNQNKQFKWVRSIWIWP